MNTAQIERQEEQIIIGIDLGTTNSLVAYVRDSMPEAIKDRKGKNTLMPSIIHFGENGKVIVGDEAKKQLVKHSDRTIFSVKRLMGKAYGDIAQMSGFLGYRIIEEEDDNRLVKIAVDQHYYTPVELSSYILRALKEQTEWHLGKPVNKAVITVPAYFNETQRQATRDAGKLAGLDVLRIINEPTAASLAYGLDKNHNKTIAVYDLGGGTFDISILHIENGVFEVLATRGDAFLGGDDFDYKIFGFWIKKFNLEEKIKNDKAFAQSLRLYAEDAKKILSTKDSYQQSFGEIDLHITRKQFEALIEDKINRTTDLVSKALRDAGLSANDIDEVVLVGGSTRIPLVRQKLQTKFDAMIHDRLNPDEVVALGAAIQADILAGKRKDMLLLDVTPLSLGIETIGGLMDTIISRNTKIPIRAARNYTTSVDGQTNLKIAVYQGERELVEDNRKLGEFTLAGIPPMAAGLPKIEISFMLDADGLLRVRAKELRSNVEQTVSIKSAYSISEEEMAKMLLESVRYAKSDIAQRALIEAITESKAILQAADKFVKQNQDWLSEMQIKAIKQYGEELKSAIETKDKNRILLAQEKLNNYTRPLAEQALEKTIGNAIKGQKLE